MGLAEPRLKEGEKIIKLIIKRLVPELDRVVPATLESRPIAIV